MLEEDANMMDAQLAQQLMEEEEANRPMSNYEKSKLKTKKMREMYGEDSRNWPEGVRPADDTQEEQLIGGEENVEDMIPHQEGYSAGGYFANYAFGNHPRPPMQADSPLPEISEEGQANTHLGQATQLMKDGVSVHN